MSADVRVAICTWNRCDLLRQALEAFTRLRIPPGVSWEIVVVNNACTDATDAVVEAFAGRLPIQLLHEPTPGVAYARSHALRTCRSTYLLFTDDDALVPEEWLTEFMNAAAAYPDAAIFGGAVDPWFVEEPPAELIDAFPVVTRGFCGLDHHLAIGDLPADRLLVTANLGIRMAMINGVTFNTRLGVNQNTLGGGEDDAFVSAVRERGGRVIWVPTLRVRHYVDPSRLRLGYLIRLARDRSRTAVREKGLSKGRRIAGAPPRLWMQYAVSLASAVAAFVTQPRITAAGRWARAEHYRAKILEYRLLSREQRHA